MNEKDIVVELTKNMADEICEHYDSIIVYCLINGLPIPKYGFSDKGLGPIWE